MTVNDNALSIHVQIKEPLIKPIIRSQIYLQSLENGQYEVELMNRTIDVCKFLSNKLHEPLLQIAYQIVQDYGTAPDSCPVKEVCFGQQIFFVN